MHFQNSPLLRLKYFIILTSKREIYPTIGNDKNQGKFRTVLFNISGGGTTATPPRSPSSPQEKEKDSEGVVLMKVCDENIDEAGDRGLAQSQLPDLVRPSAGEPNIIPESVHYVGYFSNHEQSMQTVVQVLFSY